MLNEAIVPVRLGIPRGQTHCGRCRLVMQFGDEGAYECAANHDPGMPNRYKPSTWQRDQACIAAEVENG